MSSSALASARRRRASNDPTGVPPVSRVTKTEPVETPVQNQPITPLLVLQQHELKIKQLEGLITKEEDYEELFQQIDEKIDKLFTVNFEVFNNELNAIKSRLETANLSIGGTSNVESTLVVNTMKSLFEDKLAIQGSIIDDFKNSQTQLFSLHKDDTNKVMNLLSSNMETKMTLINNTNMQLEGKINELSVACISQKNNNDALTKCESELNTVKMTVINSQSLILEMSNTINTLKDTIREHREHIDSLTSKLDAQSSVQDQRRSTQALFSSLMSNNLFGAMNSHCSNPNGMSYCCEAEECEPNDEMYDFVRANACNLNIDQNDDELIMDENQIAELLEIKDFDTINIDDSVDNVDNELDNDVEVIDCENDKEEDVKEEVKEEDKEEDKEEVKEDIKEDKEEVKEDVKEEEDKEDKEEVKEDDKEEVKEDETTNVAP